MARSRKFIEDDLEWCTKAILQTHPCDDMWNRLVKTRNELLIELKQSEFPVDKEPEVKWIYLPSKFNI